MKLLGRYSSKDCARDCRVMSVTPQKYPPSGSKHSSKMVFSVVVSTPGSDSLTIATSPSDVPPRRGKISHASLSGIATTEASPKRGHMMITNQIAANVNANHQQQSPMRACSWEAPRRPMVSATRIAMRQSHEGSQNAQLIPDTAPLTSPRSFWIRSMSEMLMGTAESMSSRGLRNSATASSTVWSRSLVGSEPSISSIFASVGMLVSTWLTTFSRS
mmetsp:Transcript_37206/g.91585  ORF Transcript_37206/g.91585 Transcript_37206/m.91585 type:complete len:217 (+) Transcript_37206:905-1555(+)